jgi:HAD superfamily hydrolase (TIGR01509 family)
MHIDGILFDLDETLINNAATRSIRFRRAVEKLAELTGDCDVEAVMLRFDQLPAHQDRLKLILSELGHHDCEKGRLAYETLFDPRDLNLHDGVEDMLRSLAQRYKLGLVTNGGGASQLPKIQKFRLAEHFGEAYAIGNDYGFPKPDPRIFRHVAEVLGCRPEHTVFVGDRLDLDIDGAKAAGMVAIWVKGTPQPPDYAGPDPDYTLDRVADLPALLDRISANSHR